MNILWFKNTTDSIINIPDLKKRISPKENFPVSETQYLSSKHLQKNVKSKAIRKMDSPLTSTTHKELPTENRIMTEVLDTLKNINNKLDYANFNNSNSQDISETLKTLIQNMQQPQIQYIESNKQLSTNKKVKEKVYIPTFEIKEVESSIKTKDETSISDIGDSVNILKSLRGK